MHFRGFGITILLFSTISFSFANGRSPAVEDFVGIEVEQTESNPQSPEALVNLEQDLGRIETVQREQPMAPFEYAKEGKSAPWSAGTWFGIFIIMGLPVLIWMLVMNHLRTKATLENASNIEVLEKYRKEREAKKKA